MNISFTDKEMTDPEFGQIKITHNARAKRLKLKIEADGLVMVIPSLVSTNIALRFIEENRDRIRVVRDRVRSRTVGVIDEEHPLKTLTFTTHISRTTERKVIYYKLSSSVLYIEVPNEFDINSREVQQKMKKGIEHFLRLEAKRILPPRLEFLADKWGFKYADLKIQSSHGRWGSCSSKGNINLSMYVLLLPPDLADSVMLHELCHTKEMNHGPKFWQLMDKVTEGRARILRQKINKYACGL